MCVWGIWGGVHTVCVGGMLCVCVCGVHVCGVYAVFVCVCVCGEGVHAVCVCVWVYVWWEGGCVWCVVYLCVVVCVCTP